MSDRKGMPGLTAMDHIGLVVPDMNEAIAFFGDVIGCDFIYSGGSMKDDNGTFMQDKMNIHPRANMKEVVFMRCGNGSNIELFDFEAPAQKRVYPRNSDIGGYHLCFYVEDIEAAADYLTGKGVKVFDRPELEKRGPGAGESWVYFEAPWGLQMELISYPNGKAYETDAPKLLWKPAR
jgi:catechol 2,3-dioxygenase-like lactoylglutathione lyase family enzyme